MLMSGPNLRISALLAGLMIGTCASVAAQTGGSGESHSTVTNMSPPSAGDATVNEARERILVWLHYLEHRKDVEFGIYFRTRLTEVLRRHGVPDWQQAVLLGGQNWTSGGSWQTGGVAPNIIAEFYGPNIVPLSKSLAALVKPGAPTHVARADLDYMGEQMKRLLAFEPTVLQLIDAALDLEGERALLQSALLEPNEDFTKANLIFDLNLASPGEQAPIVQLVPSEDNPFYELAFPKEQHQDLKTQLEGLLSKRDELLKRFRALPIQFTVELGMRSDKPAPPEPNPAAEPIPDDAIPD